jgi:phage tail-like protein
MARAAAEDLFHSFRFWAFAQRAGGGADPLTVSGAEAGFSAITTPEYSLEAVEYREGNSIFTKKYPGLPTTADLTFSRGVVLQDTGFYNWLIETVASGNEYRADVTIIQFHRSGLPAWDASQKIPTDVTQPKTRNPQRNYIVYEAFPIRVKPAGDLDASTADVSVAEADVAYEYFQITDTTA